MRGFYLSLVLSVVCMAHLGYGEPVADGFEKRGIPARASVNIVDPTPDTAILTPSAALEEKRDLTVIQRCASDPFSENADVKPAAAPADKRGIPSRNCFSIIDPTSNTADLQPAAVQATNVTTIKRAIPARAGFIMVEPTLDTADLKAEIVSQYSRVTLFVTAWPLTRPRAEPEESDRTG
ncbi:hypothetical protein BC835DRAFT_1310163 [Cytidiella melzeri]|nr:hypothetical protein BC835DRAFT_1310163 [Cytidiella melzeri]